MNNAEDGKYKPVREGELTMKVPLDVSEALTGLKAVQREAREATKALRELESNATTTYKLQAESLKNQLANGSKTEHVALAFIEELEAKVRELEVHLNNGGDSE